MYPLPCPLRHHRARSRQRAGARGRPTIDRRRGASRLDPARPSLARRGAGPRPRARRAGQRRGRPPARRMHRRRPRTEPRSRRSRLRGMTAKPMIPGRPRRCRGVPTGSISSRWMRLDASSTVSSCPGPGRAGVPGRDARLRAGRDGVGRGPAPGLRDLRRRPALEPLLGRRVVARLGVARRRADRHAGRLVLGRRPHRRLGAGPRRRHVASLVGRHALGRLGAPLGPARSPPR